MKKIILFLALVSTTIFIACNKQDATVDLIPADQDSPALTTNDKTDNLDFDNSLLDTGKADFVINNEDKAVFEKNPLLLTNKSVNAVSYEWDFGNGDTSTEAVPDYEYKIHGVYTVTLTITDVNGKKHQARDEIMVLCVFGGGPHDQ